MASLEKLLSFLKILFSFFYETSYLKEEVNCTALSPSVSVPWMINRPGVNVIKHFSFVTDDEAK
jgi:hypothetical protein